jgi:hypothetical protein
MYQLAPLDSAGDLYLWPDHNYPVADQQENEVEIAW